MSGYSVYVLDWTDRGGRQYVGLTRQAVETRVSAHRCHRAGVVKEPWEAHGEPRVEVVDTGLDACAGAELERREIAYRTVYNRNIGGDLGPSRIRRPSVKCSIHAKYLSRLEAIAESRGCSISTIVREAVLFYLRESKS